MTSMNNELYPEMDIGTSKLGLDYLLQAANHCEKPQVDTYITSSNMDTSDNHYVVPEYSSFTISLPAHPTALSEALGHTRNNVSESVWDHVLVNGHLPVPVSDNSAIKPLEFSPVEKDNLRKGRWTPEEETYAESLIAAFRDGRIKLKHSMSLRKFLAESLNCDPMRISKKFPCLKAYKLHHHSNNVDDSEDGYSNSCHSIINNNNQGGHLLKNILNHDTNMDIESNNQSESGYNSDDETSAENYQLRRGRWTAEEEAYAEAMIRSFKLGQLPLPGSTSLRKFLAEVLRCHPMRVSKKFVGCVRKYHYYQQRAEKTAKDPTIQKEVIANLYRLEKKFLESVKLENLFENQSS